MVFMAGFSGWGIRSETLYAWYPDDGRTDWAKMKMRERERGGCIHTDKGVFNNASTWLSSFFFFAHRLFPAGCVA